MKVFNKKCLDNRRINILSQIYKIILQTLLKNQKCKLKKLRPVFVKDTTAYISDFQKYLIMPSKNTQRGATVKIIHFFQKLCYRLILSPRRRRYLITPRVKLTLTTFPIPDFQVRNFSAFEKKFRNPPERVMLCSTHTGKLSYRLLTSNVLFVLFLYYFYPPAIRV